MKGIPDTLAVGVGLTPIGEALLRFAEVASTSSPEPRRALFLLYDLFALTRDRFDRLAAESEYLADMHRSVDGKRVILPFLTGRRVLDVGAGGGVVLELLAAERPDLEVVGVDASREVIECLEKLRIQKGRSWRIIEGDAFDLEQCVSGPFGRIVFSAFLHEVFSLMPPWLPPGAYSGPPPWPSGRHNRPGGTAPGRLRPQRLRRGTHQGGAHRKRRASVGLSLLFQQEQAAPHPAAFPERGMPVETGRFQVTKEPGDFCVSGLLCGPTWLTP